MIEHERRFRQLRVWVEGVDLARAMYRLTARFPTQERLGLASQLRRAAVSVPSNVAEGSVRSRREFRHFVAIALGSLAEIETQIEIARDFVVGESDLMEVTERVRRTRMMLYRLHAALGGHPSTTKTRRTPTVNSQRSTRSAK